MLKVFLFVSVNILFLMGPVYPTPYRGGNTVLPHGNNTDAYDDRIFFLQPISNNNNAATCVSNPTCCRYRCPAIAPGAMTLALAALCASGAASGSSAARCIAGDGVATNIMPGTLCVFSLTCPACFDSTAPIACVGLPECTRILGNSICPYT